MRTRSRKRNPLRVALWLLIVMAMCLNAIPCTTLAEVEKTEGPSSARSLTGAGTLRADDSGALFLDDDAGSFALDGTALFIEDAYEMRLDDSLAGRKGITLPGVSGGSLTILADAEVEVTIRVAASPVSLSALSIEGSARVNIISSADTGLATRLLTLGGETSLSVDAKKAAIALFADGDNGQDSAEGTIQARDRARLSLKAETGIVAVGQGLFYGTDESRTQFEGRRFTADANPTVVVLDNGSEVELLERYDVKGGASEVAASDPLGFINGDAGREGRLLSRNDIFAAMVNIEQKARRALRYVPSDAEGDATPEAATIGEDFSGSGRFYDETGLVYEGDIVNGAFEGQGIFYERDGRPKAQGEYLSNALQSGNISYTNCEGNRARQAIDADGSANAVKAKDRQVYLGDEALFRHIISAGAIDDSVLTRTNALFFREHEIKRTLANRQEPEGSPSISRVDCITREPGVVGDVAISSEDQGNSPTYHLLIVTGSGALSGETKFVVIHQYADGQQFDRVEGSGEVGETVTAEDWVRSFDEPYSWEAEPESLVLAEDEEKNVITITYYFDGDPEMVAFTVRHVDGNGREVAREDSGNGEAGGLIYAKDYARDFGDGFVWSADADPLELAEDADENVMTITYTGSGEGTGFTVRHVDGNGREVAPEEDGNGAAGDFIFAEDYAIDFGRNISWSADINPMPLVSDAAQNIMTITYTGTGESTTFTVRHVDGNGGEVAPEEDGIGAAGDFIFAEDYAIDFGPGISWSADVNPMPLAPDAGQNIMTITYTGSGQSTAYRVRHIDGNGTPVAPEDTGTDQVGNFIPAERFVKTLNGYTASPDVNPLPLTENPSLNVMTITYTHDGGEVQYTIRYVDITGSDVLYMDGGMMKPLEARTGTANSGDVIRAQDEVDRVAGKTVGYEYVDALIGVPSDNKVDAEMTLPYGNNVMTLRYRKSDRNLLIIEGYTTLDMYAKYKRNWNYEPAALRSGHKHSYPQFVEATYCYVVPGEEFTYNELFNRLNISKNGFELTNAAVWGGNIYTVTDQPVQLVCLDCDYDEEAGTHYYLDVKYKMHAYDESGAPVEFDDGFKIKGEYTVEEGALIDIDSIKEYCMDYERIIESGYRLDEERTIRENNLPRRAYAETDIELQISFIRNEKVKLEFCLYNADDRSQDPVTVASDIFVREGTVLYDVNGYNYDSSGWSTRSYVQQKVNEVKPNFEVRLYDGPITIEANSSGTYTLYGEMSTEELYRVWVDFYLDKGENESPDYVHSTKVIVKRGFGKTEDEWEDLANDLKDDYSVTGYQYNRWKIDTDLMQLPEGVTFSGMELSLYYKLEVSTELLGYQFELVDGETGEPIAGLPLIPVGEEHKRPMNWLIDGSAFQTYFWEVYDKLIDQGYYIGYGNKKNWREEELLVDGQIYKLYCDRAAVKFEVTFLTKNSADDPILKLTGRAAWGTPLAELIDEAMRVNPALKDYRLTDAKPTTKLVYEESPDGATNAFLVYVEPTSQPVISAHTLGDGVMEDIAP